MGFRIRMYVPMMMGAVFISLVGCGREVPEGYAKVTLNFGNPSATTTLPLREFFSAVSCLSIPTLFVKVTALDIDVPPISNVGSATLDLNSGSGLFNTGGTISSPTFIANPVSVLVKKGVGRTIAVLGSFYNGANFNSSGSATSDCTSATSGTTVYGFPIIGSLQNVTIDGPMNLAVPTLIPTYGFQVINSAPLLPPGGGPLGVLRVTMVNAVFPSGGCYSPGFVKVTDITDSGNYFGLTGNPAASTPGVSTGGGLGSAVGAQHFMGPLASFRNYDIEYLCGGTPQCKHFTVSTGDFTTAAVLPVNFDGGGFSASNCP